MIGSFIYPFLQRIMSGAASYFGYSHNLLGIFIMSLAMAFYPFLTPHSSWLFALFYVVNVITVGMKFISFDTSIKGWLNKYKDIHLWENLVTGGYMLFLSLTGFNIILLMCSVYPALIIHKGLINLGSKLPFFAEATDDATGKTYGIPLLGIKIKRSGTKFRLIAAGLSILIAVLVLLLNINIHFNLV